MQADPASHKLKLAVAVIFLVGLLAVLGLFSYGLRQLTHVSARVDANQKINTAALCALREFSLNQYIIDALASVHCPTESDGDTSPHARRAPLNLSAP